jgi:hypothetical protein
MKKKKKVKWKKKETEDKREPRSETYVTYLTADQNSLLFSSQLAVRRRKRREKPIRNFHYIYLPLELLLRCLEIKTRNLLLFGSIKSRDK